MKRQERQRSAELPQADGNDDRQSSAELDRHPSAEQVRQSSADIPISVNPLDEPISKADISTGRSAIEINAAIDSDFETFWQQYPRRVGRLKAEKIYSGIIKSKQASAAELLAGAGRYAAEREGQDPKFTKHPATWLNGGCWSDEPAPSPGLAKKGSVYAGLVSFVNGGSRGK
jgi:hypothetical protein